MIENNRYYWSHLKTRTVTVRVNPKENPQGVVFRVKSMVDVGKGRQMVVLEALGGHSQSIKKSEKQGICIPLRMGNLDFVYTSKFLPIIQNIHALLNAEHKDATVERVVSEVLSPSDLLVFHQRPDDQKLKMVDVLRVVKETENITSKASYAL